MLFYIDGIGHDPITEWQEIVIELTVPPYYDLGDLPDNTVGVPQSYPTLNRTAGRATWWDRTYFWGNAWMPSQMGNRTTWHSGMIPPSLRQATELAQRLTMEMVSPTA